MKELTLDELDQVSGGSAMGISIGIGVVGGGLAAAYNGGGASDIAMGAMLGGLATFTAGIAATGTLGAVGFSGIARVAHGANSIGFTVASAAEHNESC